MGVRFTGSISRSCLSGVYGSSLNAGSSGFAPRHGSSSAGWPIRIWKVPVVTVYGKRPPSPIRGRGLCERRRPGDYRPMHDLVIRGGTIVDGSGAPGRIGDVAIDGDRLSQIGGTAGAARREIDATGCIVAPGWVDIHTH